MKKASSNLKKKPSGFTLLEVMVAISIIAIAITASLTSQSQSVSLAGEAKFSTTAVFLAQYKLAELDVEDPDELMSDAGDFGEEFPDYRWDLTVNDVTFAGAEEITQYLKRIDLDILWGSNDRYRYGITKYYFSP